jgi:hypothetical protein
MDEDEDPLKKWFAWQRRQHTEKVGGRDRMVVGFTTICAISAFHH